MVKARVGLQLKEAFLGSKLTTSKKQSLEVLENDFKRMRVNLRQLIEALRAQHLTLLRMNDTRLKVALKIAALAEGSAICEEAGDVPHSTGSSNGGDLSSDVSSYMSIHTSVSVRQKTNADRYLKHIVDYAIEWEKVIVARVTTSLKTSEDLRRDLDHYTAKVESLKLEINKLISRGKLIDTKVTTRLQRNDEKRSLAKRQYDKFSAGLLLLLEEVVVRGWKDLHPILLKLAQFDKTVAVEEGGAFGNMQGVVTRLERIGSDCGLQVNSGVRLRELGEMSAENGLAVENSVGGGINVQPQALNSNLVENESSSSAIVSTGAYGASYDANETYHGQQQSQTGSNDANESYHGYEHSQNGMGLSTTQMMSVAGHSAPPPTMDMVDDAFRTTSIDAAPPPPPPPPQQQQQQYTSAPPPPPPSSSSLSNPFGMAEPSTGVGNNPFGGPIPSTMPTAPPPPPQFPASIYGNSASSSTAITPVHRSTSPYGDSLSNNHHNNAHPQQHQQQQQQQLRQHPPNHRATSPFDPHAYVAPSRPMGSGGNGAGNQNYHNPFE